MPTATSLLGAPIPLKRRMRMWIPLLMAASLSAGAGEERPGVGKTPAYVCVGTTITEKGHTKQAHVVGSSGNLKSDRNALRMVRMTKFTSDSGEKREAMDVLIVVKMFATGHFAFKVMEPDDELLVYCDPERERPKGT